METQAPSRSSFSDRTRSVLTLRRPGEADGRLGCASRFLGLYLLLVVALIILRVEAEAGLGVTLAYWPFIGVPQCVYVSAALLARRTGIAWGLLRGAGIIAAINVVAWGIGLWIGPC